MIEHIVTSITSQILEMINNKQIKKEEEEEVVEYVEEDFEGSGDEYEIVYEEIEVTDSEEESDIENESVEDIEYEYITEVVEEEVEKESDLQKKRQEALREQYAELEKINKRFSASLRHMNPSLRSLSQSDSGTFRKSVSFSSVHSVLTENDEVIFVDEADDIFK